jgi:hypothetical protein
MAVAAVVDQPQDVEIRTGIEDRPGEIQNLGNAGTHGGLQTTIIGGDSS